ncbi:hypothetical protein M8J75_007479 [Diaphorina citri]|nr:hypothetical protein M8J75_007479 [Diaphorina citri]
MDEVHIGTKTSPSSRLPPGTQFESRPWLVFQSMVCAESAVLLSPPRYPVRVPALAEYFSPWSVQKARRRGYSRQRRRLWCGSVHRLVSLST